MKKPIGNVSIEINLHTEELLEYYVGHAKEIQMRASLGNLAAQRVQRRAGRLEKSPRERYVMRFVEAVYIYRVSLVN